eukprot:scaffold28787_cov67-Phaeocystis_antarctica.AAC.2
MAFNNNETTATATYGPVADWGVSKITDMSYLFQNLKNFNTDISNWNTSSATTMRSMFRVRSSPCPATNLQSRPLLHAACAAVVHRLLPPDPCTSPRTACPSFDARQLASAFNQPLSVDTSSVTDMQGMFQVRSSPCPAPQSAAAPSPACCVRHGRPPPAAPRPVHLAPHRMPYFRLSAGRVGVQPATELRHLQRHRHVRHVLRALLSPCPAPPSAAAPSPARCVRRGRPPPAAPRPAYRAPHRMPFFRLSAACVGVQPATELRHLQRHEHARHVLRALLPACSAPTICSCALPCACYLRRGRPPPAAPRPVYRAPHRMPFSRLSAARVGVQPAAELRHLQRHKHELHVRGALLPVPYPISAAAPSPARCVPPRSVVHRLLPPDPYTAPRTACPSYRLSAVRVGVQPAAEPQHLQRHRHELHVLRALLPVPCPPICSRALPCTLRAPQSSTACCPTTRLVGVQPDAELRHLQRHEHVPHVLRALLPPCPAPQSAAAPSPACCVRHGRPPPAAPRPVHLAPHHMPLFQRSAVRVGVQPAAELRNLQRHNHVRHVPSTLLSACPAPQSAAAPSPARCVHRGRPPPAAPPTRIPRPAPHALLSTLGSLRRRSTSR